MKKNSPVLSICIPTYNRWNYLECLLESFQLSNPLTKETEILVSNDCSTDGTLAGLTEVLSKSWFNKRLRVKHCAKKRNWMEHMMEMPLLAQGEYVWIIGDDDLLLPGAIDCVLSLLKKFEPDVLLLNKKVKSHDLRQTFKEQQHYLDGPAVFSSFADLAVRFGIITEIGFTSCLLFKRRPIIEEDPWPWLRSESIYAQTFRLFSAFKRSKCVAVENVCVVHRQQNQRKDQTDVAFLEALKRIPFCLNTCIQKQSLNPKSINHIIEELAPQEDNMLTLPERLLSILKNYPEKVKKITDGDLKEWEKLKKAINCKNTDALFESLKTKNINTFERPSCEYFSCNQIKAKLNARQKIKREIKRILNKIKKIQK